MNSTIIIEIIGAIGAVVAGMFGLMRYVIKSTERVNKQFLDYIEKRDEDWKEYQLSKNNHIERISEKFNESAVKLVVASQAIIDHLKEDHEE